MDGSSDVLQGVIACMDTVLAGSCNRVARDPIGLFKVEILSRRWRLDQCRGQFVLLVDAGGVSLDCLVSMLVRSQLERSM